MTTMTKAHLSLPSWRGTLYQVNRGDPEEAVAFVRSKKPRLLVGGKETWLPARVELVVLEENLIPEEAHWLAHALTQACADVMELDAQYPAHTPAEAMTDGPQTT
jgi:hypothetical protein